MPKVVLGMNIFEKFVEKLKYQYRNEGDLVVRFARPLDRCGFWTFSMVFSDEFLVSIAWNRHHGFMLTAGFDVAFGGAYDETFRDVVIVQKRITTLVKSRTATNFQNSVGLSELRRLHGITQADLADRLAMTKGGLSQIEGADSLLGMRVGTIEKLVVSLGGELVLTARFPDGGERNLSIS